MTHLLTYCNNRYTTSAFNLCESALKHGVDKVLTMSEYDLPVNYPALIGDNIKEVDRFHFYIWKPIAIWQYIQRMEDGELLIYADAGSTIVDSVRPVIEKMDQSGQDIMLFANPWLQSQWCKFDVADSINSEFINDERSGYNDYKSLKQAQASLIFFGITPQTRDFVKEWMLYCLMPGFCDNSPSKYRNYPGFQEHRYDQAVLTCLQIKYGYKLHEIPRIDNGNAAYRCIDHHRKSNRDY